MTVNSSPGSREELPSLELVLEHVDRQLDLQWQHWEDVDARLRLLLGFAGAIFVATLAFVSREDALSRAATGLALASIGLLMMSGIVAGLAWLPRHFDRPPSPLGLREDYVGRPVGETRLAIVDAIVDAYNKNEIAIGEKLGAFRTAAVLFAGAVGLIAVASVVALVQ